MRRFMSVLTTIVIVATMLVSIGASPGSATPVATSEEEYLAFGRVFPDPHGCQAGQPGTSPYAKGQVCAIDFLQYDETIAGVQFLEQIEGFQNFIEFYQLDQDFNCAGKLISNPDEGCKRFFSAGLPVTTNTSGEGFTRDRHPLYMARVTDESVPNKNKDHFVFSMGLHGPERAGIEGGVRAIEDLVTWGACEQSPNLDVCPNEGEIPHPIMEATPQRSLFAGDVLKRAVVYFVFMNPDGWSRGDRETGTSFYQRYNGNGVDLNRDWPEEGFTYRPYTPWSEPESIAYGKVLQTNGPTDPSGDPKWTGGIDLHGQLVDRAFSFTLIGGAERPWDKNQRVLQTVKGAWLDAEKRLAWSPLIKPNDAAADDPRMYGVQWGTVWDTIAYTVTGAFGDWIDSPIGLNADGLDNEMSISHVGNCGVGSCFDPDIEQAHVDGNKSLIYSMLNYSLKKEDTAFRTKGRVGYVFNRGAVSAPTSRITKPPKFATYPSQKDINDETLTPVNEFTFEFTVKGPSQGIYNGGIAAQLTCANAQGVSPCALDSAVLERQIPEGQPHGGEWEVVNSYFNQSPIYVQAGKALHANLPTPGQWRVRVFGEDGSQTSGVAYRLDIDFSKEKAWADPGQIGYRETNMKFWKMMKPYMQPGLTKLTPGQLLSTTDWKRRFDTIVITNKTYKELAIPLRKWVAKFNGNLVLTDVAVKMLPKMGLIKGGGIRVNPYYAGYINFQTPSRESTYKDPLAKKINQPGAAEGQSGDEIRRRQTYEPVPLGFAIQTPDGGDAYFSPVWTVNMPVWKKARGKQRAVGTTGDTTRVSYGEIRYHGGRIRFAGALLPMPTESFDHPFGLASYGLTYSGYQILNNMLSWSR
jgi:hypothetical protein